MRVGTHAMNQSTERKKLRSCLGPYCAHLMSTTIAERICPKGKRDIAALDGPFLGSAADSPRRPFIPRGGLGSYVGGGEE